MKLQSDSTFRRSLPLAAALLFCADAALAAEAPPPPTEPVALVPSPEANASEEVTRELIELLSEHGLLAKDDAQRLIDKLRAQIAKRLAASLPPAGKPASAAAPATTGSTAAAGGDAAASDPSKKPPVRVIYLPELERQRIREEVKQEVIEQAKAENWAQPNALPEWTKRFALSGDFRFRYEGDLYGGNQATVIDRTTGKPVLVDPTFINFNAINNGSPYDVNLNTNTSLPPLLDATQDRQLPRISAKLKIDARISEDFRAEFRIATGNTSNPVSTNQTLGTDFNKFSIVFDRASLSWEPNADTALRFGRVASPWVSTPMVWYGDLSFDGVTAQYQHALGEFTPFVTAGAYSIENTALDFPSTQSAKVASRDKWLYALQLGARWQIDADDNATFAAAFYDFDHLQGKLSSPCTPLIAADSCDSDFTRPGFVQKGNTLFALRDLRANPSNPNGPQYQYFGLASAFRELNLTARGDFSLGGPLRLVIDADYVRNLAYRQSRVAALVPVNNYGPATTAHPGGVYGGGANGYYGQLLVGTPRIEHRYQWNAAVGYRRVESDAVVDAFTETDFHLGGSNAKGYHVNGSIGLGDNVWLQARWFSGTEVSGPPLAIDVLQLDLNARF